jgi:hypothetical protein
MAQVAMIAGLGMMCLSSSVGAVLMMGGSSATEGYRSRPVEKEIEAFSFY